MFQRIGRLLRWLLRNYMLVLWLASLVITIWMWESGMMQETMRETYGDEGPPPLPSPDELFTRMTNEQWLPLALMAVVWMLGVPALIVLQGRKAGRSLRESFSASPFYRDFDLEAWVIFVALVIASLWLGSLAVT